MLAHFICHFPECPLIWGSFSAFLCLSWHWHCEKHWVFYGCPSFSGLPHRVLIIQFRLCILSGNSAVLILGLCRLSQCPFPNVVAFLCFIFRTFTTFWPPLVFHTVFILDLLLRSGGRGQCQLGLRQPCSSKPWRRKGRIPKQGHYGLLTGLKLLHSAWWSLPGLFRTEMDLTGLVKAGHTPWPQGYLL